MKSGNIPETCRGWNLDGNVETPGTYAIGSIESRIWTDRNVERVRRYKQENYRKGRAPKPKPKREKKRACRLLRAADKP